MKKYCINNNPKIGKVGARELVISLVSGDFEHVEIGNIGYSLTHLLTHSLTYLLTYSLTHSQVLVDRVLPSWLNQCVMFNLHGVMWI